MLLPLKIVHDRLQKIRIAIGKQLLDKPVAPLTDEHLTLCPVRKILFLRKDSKIGDMVVSSFVFREIKKNDPSIKIGIVCAPKNRNLIEGNPYIDYYHYLPSRSIRNHIALGKELAKAGYDTVIDPTIFLRNRDLLLLSMIKAKRYIGYKKADYKLFNMDIEEEMHFSEVYKQALLLCGFKDVDTSCDIPVNKESEQNVRRFLEMNNLNRYIAVNFFGASHSRQFSRNNISLFLDYFCKNRPGKNWVLLSDPDVTPKLKSLLSDRKNIHIYEQTRTIFDSIELIKSADWIISPDTAIIHIASGFNKKIIGFYNRDKANWNHWHPTTKAECRIVHFNRNINEISPETLEKEKISALLSERCL